MKTLLGIIIVILKTLLNGILKLEFQEVAYGIEREQLGDLIYMYAHVSRGPK